MSSRETQERSAWRPVRNGNPFEATVQRLAQSIKLGVVRPGERLPNERELAERLQVSRGTLREAIKVLRDADYLVSRPGRHGGNFVTEAASRGAKLGGPGSADQSFESFESGRDVLILRLALEPGAASIAARRSLTAKDRAHLSEALEAARERDPRVRRVNDSRLHLAIAAATGSMALTAAVADIQGRLDRYLALIPVLERNLEHSDRQHEMVVDAILAGDSDKARIVMEEHCLATGLLFESFLD